MGNSLKWYEKNWVMVLCFLSMIFIPVGLFLMWKFKKWHSFWKISLSVVFSIGFLFIALLIYLSNTDEFKEGYKQGISNSQSTSKNSNEKTSDTSEPTSEESKESDQQSQTEKTEKKEKETASTPDTSSNNKTSTKSPSTSSGNTGNSSSSSNKGSGSNSSSSGSTTKPNAELSKSRIVYVTPTGKKYHYANPCGKGTYKPIKLDEAIKQGYGPCEKCVLH